jgi:uncharacterized membrane protein
MEAKDGLVGVLAVTYTVVLSTFAFWAHDGLRTQMDDLGNMTQAIWAASHGDWLMTQSNDVGGSIGSRLGIHANFVFWLLALPYRLWPTPKFLLVLTSAACGAAGVGVYALGRRRLGNSWLALVPPCAFWLSPMVHDANLFDFHVITVATALVIWTIWAFDGGRRRIGWILMGLALTCQEDVAVVLVLLGGYLMMSGRLRDGVWISAVSMAYLAVVLGVIAPLVNAGHSIAKLGGNDDRYAWILTRPARALSGALQPERLRIPLYFLLSGALACLREWRFLLLLLPGALSAMLSSTGWMSRVTGTYYWVIDAGLICVACILASSRPHEPDRHGRRWPIAYLGIATALFSFILSPLPYGLGSSWKNHDRSNHASELAAIMDGVPVEAPIVVQNNLGPHLAERPSISKYPRRSDKAQYLVFYLRNVGGPSSGLFVRPEFFLLTGLEPQSLVRSVETLIYSQEWSLLKQRGGFYLFKRAAPTTLPPATRSEFSRDRRLLLTDVATAESSLSWWSRYLAGPFTWGDLWRER